MLIDWLGDGESPWLRASLIDNISIKIRENYRYQDVVGWLKIVNLSRSGRHVFGED